MLLPMHIGYHRAAELLFLGEPFTAAIAHQCGLIAEVTADGDELRAATAAASKLAAKPPAALRLTKMLMKKSMADAVAKQMSEEGLHFAQRLRSPEVAEAFQAFLEKRAPDFSKFN